MSAEIVLEALVQSRAERPPFVAAAHQLSSCLKAVSGVDHRVTLNLRSLGARDIGARKPDVTMVSMLGEVHARGATFADIADQWRERISALTAAATWPVFLCTIFRHVPAPASDRPSQAWVLERIRRLNLLAAALSQATGVGVIDIDRVLAHVGARRLQTDYLLTGPFGAKVAGDVIVSALLTAGLDDCVRDEWLQQAQRLRGGGQALEARLHKLLQHPIAGEQHAGH